MKKVKLIYDKNYKSLESRINDFIEDKKIIKISISETNVNYTVLILYEEGEEDEIL